VGGAAVRGVDGLARVIEQLAGVPVPASTLESLVLPIRVADYTPGMLDELTTSGEVVWAGAGALPGTDGWVVLAPAEHAALLLAPPGPDTDLDPLEQAVLAALDGDAALFFRALADRLASGTPQPSDSSLASALWRLVWAGRITNDSLAPLRVRLGSRALPPRSRSPRRVRALRPALPSRTGPPGTSGRWSAVPTRDPDPTRRAHALADALIDRHGVLTRGAVIAERVAGGFAGVYPVLRAFEEAGRCRRGYFIESLGAAQFASPGAVDRLRALARDRPEEPLWETPVPRGWVGDRRGPSASGPGALVLAATDPANPYGGALHWPDDGDGGHRPARKAGALVVLVDGALALYVERGGRTLLSFTPSPAALRAAADALALAVRDGQLGRLAVERADGAPVLASPLGAALEEAGFRPTPRGLRLRG